ncbi:hypothetical protein GQ53DRAFT_743921 [Thozetella sp. PMI_491]|nr:hypothetical protein GQ53DRAFT_743921 [Thozetella sp. PMI_491]
MPPGQTPTYHLAPRFSILPPPKGELNLGTIITDLKLAEPVNSDCRLPIPDDAIYTHKKEGFTTTRARLNGGEYGVWAKVVGLTGIGGELSYNWERSDEDNFSFKQLEEISFNPKMDYMRLSMAEEDVKEHIEGTGYKPVFMITGLKIAHGPAIEHKMGRKWEAKAEVGVSQLPVSVPIEAGPKVSHRREKNDSEGWEKSDDFIYGFRVKKLQYKSGVLVRKKDGKLVAETYLSNATLVDNDDEGELIEEVEVEDDLGEEIQDMGKQVEEDETIWVVPKDL